MTRDAAPGTVPGSVRLVERKLRPPHVRAAAPCRATTLRRLAGSDAQVVIVVAAAGYGKSTALGQWAAAEQHPFGWLCLEDADNEPARLIAYLTAALERAGVLAVTAAGALPARPRKPSPQDALTRFGELISSVTGPLVLVLDDAHRLRGAEPAAVISTMIDNLPASCRLVLSGRATPAVPLERLRAQGRLLEIGTSDLELTPREARALLRGAGIRLSAADAAALHLRTEGWPAGIYLAGLSLADAPAGSRPSLDHVESDRFISDYLRYEVLSGLGEHDLAFLTRTAVLDRMTGDLCDALLHRRDSAQRLEAFEAGGMFVVALDRRRAWYRYHGAFRSLLAAELARRRAGRGRRPQPPRRRLVRGVRPARAGDPPRRGGRRSRPLRRAGGTAGDARL